MRACITSGYLVINKGCPPCLTLTAPTKNTWYMDSQSCVSVKQIGYRWDIREGYSLHARGYYFTISLQIPHTCLPQYRVVPNVFSQNLSREISARGRSPEGLSSLWTRTHPVQIGQHSFYWKFYDSIITDVSSLEISFIQLLWCSVFGSRGPGVRVILITQP